MDIISQYQELKERIKRLTSQCCASNGLLDELDVFEQRLIENEKKIQSEELFFKFLAENIVDVVWVLDVNEQKFVYVSPSVEKLRGYKTHEINKELPREVLTPESAKKMEESIKARVPLFLQNPDNQNIYYDEIEQPHKDGTVIVSETSSFFRINETNKHIEAVGVTRDITQRKKLEKSQKESELRFQNIFERHNAIMLLVEPESGLIVDANEAAAKFYGYSKANLCTMSINNINTLTPEEVLAERWNAINENRNYFIFPHKLASGIERMVEVHSSPIEIQEQKLLFSIIHDITERIQALQALSESENKFRKIVEMLGEGVALVNTKEKFVFANSAAEQIFGVANGGLIGKSLSVFLDEKGLDKIKTQTSLRQKGEQSTYDLEINTITGTMKSIIVTATPFYDSSNQIVGTYGVFRDITDRKLIELKIQQQNKALQELNATKDKFFSILAHDLKNPFNTILGFSELLLENLAIYDLEKIENLVTYIRNISSNTYNLLEELLLWAKSQSGQLSFVPRKINFIKVCQDIVERLKANADTKGISINCFAATEITLMADDNMFKTVLRNLISNAIKFTAPNGHINIYAERKQNVAVITVSDNGVGIESEDFDKLWDITTHFTTRGTANEKGSGFGLVLCKEFVEKHNGKIWVESKLGKGSDFKFTMPISIEQFSTH